MINLPKVSIYKDNKSIADKEKAKIIGIGTTNTEENQDRIDAKVEPGIGGTNKQGISKTNAKKDSDIDRIDRKKVKDRTNAEKNISKADIEENISGADIKQEPGISGIDGEENTSRADIEKELSINHVDKISHKRSNQTIYKQNRQIKRIISKKTSSSLCIFFFFL